VRAYCSSRLAERPWQSLERDREFVTLFGLTEGCDLETAVIDGPEIALKQLCALNLPQVFGKPFPGIT
jgi:hypothetical protein